MISVGVRELREDLSKLLQRVRDEGEVIEITVHGEPVAHVTPIKRRPRSPEEVERMFVDLDQLASEIAANWQDDLDAVEAVREQRREL